MGDIFKIYDLSASTEDARRYWDHGMQSIYFKEPDYFLGRILNSPIYSFLNRFLPEEGLILDGGCGSNYLSKLFSTPKRRWVGLDFAVGNLEEGRKLHPQVTSVAGNLLALPFRDSCFDAVVSLSACEHVEAGMTGLLHEFFRVLKPGGSLLLLLPTFTWEDRFTDWLSRGTSHAKGWKKIPHFAHDLHFKKVREPEVERQEGFFAYWYSGGYLRNLIRSADFELQRQIPLDIPGGMLRSRIMKPLGRRIFERFPLSKKRLSSEHFTRSERIFLREDIFESRLESFLHRLVGTFYRYLFGIVALK